MKQFWKIVGIAALVAVVGAAAAGVVANAQDGGESSAAFDLTARFKEALSTALGVSVDEYDAAVQTAQDQVVDDALAEGWLTDDQAELFRWRLDRAPGDRMDFFGRGFDRLGRGALRGDSLLSIAAEQLDISLTDLLTELEADKSIADVCAEKGVDPQVIVDAHLAQIEENLDESVAEGRITQKQADYLLQQAEERVIDRLDNVGPGGLRGGRHRGASRGSSGVEGL